VASLLPPVVRETPALTALRHEVREFLAAELDAGLWRPGVDTWLTEWDPEFSRRLAARGWVGMTVPVRYGGRGRGFLERFVVTEELLAAAAPVAYHWIADRQVAPSILRFGTDEQKAHWLPRIAAGECAFGIGMSEPDSGSDLASVRTRAERVDGGWRVTGTKVWTSGAHEADAFIALVRTSPVDPGDRHAGLTQLLVDLRAEGVRISPIRSMTGRHHFNEVHLDGVLVPDSGLLGEVGDGWHQVTSELAYERSGPERWLSTFPLVRAWASGDVDCGEVGLGSALARMRGLHQMSLAVAGALEAGDDADVAAAMVKLLGTTFEGDVAEAAHLATRADPGTPYAEAVAHALLQRPGFTLRGGTNEVLRGVLARGLGLRGSTAASTAGRAARPGTVDPDFAELVETVFADHAATVAADAPLDVEDPALAARLEELGLARLTTPEDAGGSGATWHEAAVVLRAAARHGLAVDAVLADLVPDDLDPQERSVRLGLATAVAMTGAMDAAVDLTIRHVRERTQFGRPLAAFQAVQSLVADAASEAALARAATDAALAEAVEHGFTGTQLATSVAAARSVCARSGSVVVRATHQAHGAIGTTLEHALHRLTMPLLTWTTAAGPVPDAEEAVAAAARREGAWAVVSGTPTP
jgi:alkylation response protein AidB-like acyl-CoA dehydrogenase